MDKKLLQENFDYEEFELLIDTLVEQSISLSSLIVTTKLSFLTSKTLEDADELVDDLNYFNNKKYVLDKLMIILKEVYGNEKSK